jgi:hypothetical protein
MIVNGSLENISSGLKQICAERLVDYITHHIKITRKADRRMAEGHRSTFLTEGVMESLFNEADEMLKRISLVLTDYMQIHMVPNPEKLNDIKTVTRYHYYRKIKQHQIELLIQISEDIEMIKSLFEQTYDMSRMVFAHSKSLLEANWVNGTVEERIAQRPMAIERVKYIEASGKNPPDVHFTSDSLADDGMPIDGSTDAEHLFQSCYGLIRETYDEIEHRGLAIRLKIKELKDGWALFKKLVQQKPMRRIKKRMDILIHNHNQRILQFQETVKAFRNKQFAGDTGQAAMTLN